MTGQRLRKALAFLDADFSLKLAADHTSTTTPRFSRLVGMHSSQETSLLHWAEVLSLATSIALRATRNRHREIVPWATAVLTGLASFFTGLLLFDANPFAHLDPAPVQGAGLGPLLRHSIDAPWLRSTRRFALIAWIFLGLGLVFGSRWSYWVLGWGGYRGWDPVENAALMPCLVDTAFLHSSIVQEMRGMLRTRNVSLICATFTLALFGTFLVRSAAQQSIHTFGASTVGAPGWRSLPAGSRLIESLLSLILGALALALAFVEGLGDWGALLLGVLAAYILGRQLILPLRAEPRQASLGRSLTIALAAAALVAALLVALRLPR